MKGKDQKRRKSMNIYQYALQLERDSENYYRELAQKTENIGLQNILKMLAEEEKKHLFLLENVVEFVSRPETWIENAEFNHLDDY